MEDHQSFFPQRVHKFLHLSLDIANSAFIYMANKLEQIGSRVWEDVEFWPDCIAEGVTIWVSFFSFFSFLDSF